MAVEWGLAEETFSVKIYFFAIDPEIKSGLNKPWSLFILQK